MVYDSMISLGREEEYMRMNGMPNVLTEVAQRIATVLGGVLAELEQEVVMLEIPESRTIAAQMNETIQGKRILEAEAAHTPHSFAWYSGEPAFYAEIMEGREIGRAESLGSMIEMRLGDYSFVVGDGTNARYFAPGESCRRSTRFALPWRMTAMWCVRYRCTVPCFWFSRTFMTILTIWRESVSPCPIQRILPMDISSNCLTGCPAILP